MTLASAKRWLTALIVPASLFAAASAPPGALQDAAWRGDLSQVTALIASRADLDGTDENGLSAMDKAAEGDHVDVVQALLAAGARPDTPKGPDSMTPLMIAALRGHETHVQALLAAKASASARTEDGATALFMATQEGRLAVVRKLLAAGARPNNWAMGKLSDLRRTELEDRDSRIFPGQYAPVMVMQNGRRVIKRASSATRTASPSSTHSMKT